MTGGESAGAPSPVDIFVGVVDKPQEVPVAREVVSELAAQAREVVPVLEKKEGGPEGACRQLEAVRTDGRQRQRACAGRSSLVLGKVSDVADRVPAAGARCEPADLTAIPQHGALVLGQGQIGVVEGVLRSVVAADVTLAAEPAGRWYAIGDASWAGCGRRRL